MPRPACREPLPLIQGAQRFARWRRRRTRREIPGELWSLAAELGVRYGVSRTARVLGLSYPGLKQRVEGARGVAPPAPGGFVEVLAGALAPRPEWLVELDGPGGVKLRIRLMGGSPAQVAALGLLLLEGRP